LQYRKPRPMLRAIVKKPSMRQVGTESSDCYTDNVEFRSSACQIPRSWRSSHCVRRRVGLQRISPGSDKRETSRSHNRFGFNGYRERSWEEIIVIAERSLGQ